MQVIISFSVKEAPLKLPIAHHHILQSIFYELMSRDEAGSPLHDEGSFYEKRNYKLFTFGPVEGKYRIEGKTIEFFEEVSLEFRSYSEDICKSIAENAVKKGVRFGEHIYKNVSATLSNKVIESDEIKIMMCSPVCVYQTDRDTRHTKYFSPEDEIFFKLVNQNFRHKYEAATGKECDDIEMQIIHFSPRDKYFTKYKGFFIEGYKGFYLLKGKPEYLSFLYDTGLGSKNSQGFGMFRLK